MAYGTVVCAGITMDISSVTLAGGVVLINAYAHGPISGGTGVVTIFGADGQGVMQGETEQVIPDVPMHCTLEFPVSVRMTYCE